MNLLRFHTGIQGLNEDEVFIGRHFVLLRFGHTIVGGNFMNPKAGNENGIEEGEGPEERYNLHDRFFDTNMTKNDGSGKVWW